VAGCRERGNEPSGSIKDGEFLNSSATVMTINFSRRTLLHRVSLNVCLLVTYSEPTTYFPVCI
jgi:hypothetical protein